ncbi:hypothetical protein V6N11_007573 [Hibiscus sabdariffa]|uniref:Uncharacterized protein n=1 Tax=Hibiscus sabdariffa TaxID=183260 RepID=A0ABR1ZBK9_9ROSI
MRPQPSPLLAVAVRRRRPFQSDEFSEEPRMSIASSFPSLFVSRTRLRPRGLKDPNQGYTPFVVALSSPFLVGLGLPTPVVGAIKNGFGDGGCEWSGGKGGSMEWRWLPMGVVLVKVTVSVVMGGWRWGSGLESDNNGDVIQFGGDVFRGGWMLLSGGNGERAALVLGGAGLDG